MFALCEEQPAAMSGRDRLSDSSLSLLTAACRCCLAGRAARERRQYGGRPPEAPPSRSGQERLLTERRPAGGEKAELELWAGGRPHHAPLAEH